MTWTRRDLLKLTASAGGVLLLPPSVALLADQNPVRPAPSGAANAGRERLLADFGWKFHFGHANDPAKDFGLGTSSPFSKSGSVLPGGGRGNPAPTQAAFDDASWTSVNLPHDWAVELPFENTQNRNIESHGFKPIGRMYPETSIGWYRRTFDVPQADLGRRISLEFDGAFRDATILLNGHYIGRNFSGYAPFRFDVTDFITYGGKNALVVRVDATESEGWFYEGAGIYRHVWLVKTAPLHVGPWGTFVRTEPASDGATVVVATEIENESDRDVTCQIESTILDESGHVMRALSAMPASVAGWGRHTFNQRIAILSPAIWSIETPHMHKLVTRVLVAGAEVDRYETPFGVRTVSFDADKGFSLNGKRVEIKGTCNHQDHAGVGAALPDRLQYFRIEKLKEMGSNAYRTSHNPPTPELLDACDRLGMIVLDETRMMSSNEEGLTEFERLIRRDRNHPSVFCWSIGNEEGEQGTDRGARVATSMKRLARQLDPSRLTTEAMNNSWGRGLSAVVDVQGFNYHTGAPGQEGKEIDDFHKQFPKQPTMGTETASTVSTRGIYANDTAKGYVSAYDRNFPPWASTAETWWKIYAARPFVAGGFAWTGFDYRGEPTPYRWPCISSHFGILDVCGFPKDIFYYYQAWWSGKPVLHLFPHWNWTGKENQEIEIWCFTNVDSVELFVNGKSVGSQAVEPNGHVAWKVPYAPGVIEARGTTTGRPLLVAKRETTGAPARILLVPDRPKIGADGEDVAVVEVQIVDAQGRIVPTASNEVTFAVTGGTLIGVGNGDPSSHEPDKADKRKAFNGLCMAIVQASKQAGEIRVDASSPGLESARVLIGAEAVTPRPVI